MKKIKAEKLDTSKWWLLSWYRKDGIVVVNDAGEDIDLNCKQGLDDYQFWKDLHLEDDTVERVGGALRYRKGAPCPMIRECIVFAHNLRHGHIENQNFKHAVSEAIYIARILMTKFPGDK